MVDNDMDRVAHVETRYKELVSGLEAGIRRVMQAGRTASQYSEFAFLVDKPHIHATGIRPVVMDNAEVVGC